MNIPRTYRHGSLSLGSKIQELQSKLFRIMNATDDDDDKELEELAELKEELEKVKDEFRQGDEQEDLDGIEPHKKHRLEEDPNITNELETDKLKARYSVLEYHVASIQNDDSFMEKIVEGHTIKENGDSLMEKIGANQND